MKPLEERTTVDYRCGDCGAQPGEPCRWPPFGLSGITTVGPELQVYHRDRERRFCRSVNRMANR